MNRPLLFPRQTNPRHSTDTTSTFWVLLSLVLMVVQTGRSDSTIHIWDGSPANGLAANTPTNVPPNLSNVVAIASGAYHLLALTPEGRVATWGYQSSVVSAGLLNVPASASNVVAIAAAHFSSLALRADGRVIAWGDNTYGKATVPPGASNISAIAAGGSHNLALRANGTVIGWGNNWFGQSTPPAGLSNVVAIAAGGNHSLALKANGTISAWGDNSSGQTKPLPSLTNVIAIDAAVATSVALKTDGTVMAWGLGFSGNVAQGLSNIVAIAAGNGCYLALRADGTVVTRIGNQSAATPALSNVISMAAGERITYFATVSGTGAPFFTLHPLPQTVKPGGAVRLHARVAGVAPISCQWQFENTDLPGETNLTLHIPSVLESHSGTYRVIASSDNGTVTSRSATLTVPPRQRLQALRRLPDGSVEFLSRDAAGDAFLPPDLRAFEVQASTNLVNWEVLPDAGDFINGSLVLRDTNAANLPRRFYRIVEH